MVYAFRYMPPDGEPVSIGNAEGEGEDGARDAFAALRDRDDGAELPPGEYQYRAVGRAIPGVMPGASSGPSFWAPLVLDPDGTINV